jgi:trans-aconitate methyltransferase
VSTTEAPRYAPEWLELREGADAAARAAELIEPLRRRLADPARPIGQAIVIRDLGCGSGSMGRWLAPRLDGPQHWVLHDHDPDLLDLAAERMPTTAADGSLVTVETVRGDVTGLTAENLAGTSLVTASALLDLFTREEVDALAAACARAGCPALLALSVMGRVELEPADPLDAEITAAFNAHQRREDHGRRLLGPDAVTAACEAFDQLDTTVRVHSSPWQLDADRAALTAEWLRGWTGAAVEQRPDLAVRAEEYLRRRLEQCAAGELRAVVHHSDLLALPRQAGGTTGGASS